MSDGSDAVSKGRGAISRTPHGSADSPGGGSGGRAADTVMEALDRLREVASAHDEPLALEYQYVTCRRVLSGDDFARRPETSEADSAA